MKKSLVRLDLNLLFTLQLLVQEQSVSKAAKKLNVTPSTVSKSLSKLREWFDDPLFVKTPYGLAPTPLVMSMEKELSAWSQMSSQILDKHSGDAPANIRFDLAVESPLALTMLSELAQAIYQRYPEARIKTTNWDYDSLDAIIRGDADIGFTGRESHPRSKELLELLPYFIDYEVLFSDLPVVYIRKDHPAVNEEWNLETFLRYPHINIEWEKRDTWALDDILNDLGFQRNAALTLSTFEQALFMAAQPNHQMLTTAPAYCKNYIGKLHPELVSLPIPLTKEDQKKLMVPFTMIWHKRNAHNPKLVWLKEQIKQLYGQVGSSL